MNGQRFLFNDCVFKKFSFFYCWQIQIFSAYSLNFTISDSKHILPILYAFSSNTASFGAMVEHMKYKQDKK